jgi:hypothetical protein
MGFSCQADRCLNSLNTRHMHQGDVKEEDTRFSSDPRAIHGIYNVPLLQ